MVGGVIVVVVVVVGPEEEGKDGIISSMDNSHGGTIDDTSSFSPLSQE